MTFRGAAVLLCLIGTSALAQTPPDCNTLQNPVYLSTTTIMKPFYARVAAKLATATGAQKMTLVYKANSTCLAYSTLLPPGTPLTGTGIYWEDNGAGTIVEKTCNFPSTPAITPTVAVGDVTVETCTGNPPPTGFKQFQTYAQAFGFIVPLSSTQTAITAEEAYFLFKFGAAAGNQVPPWTDPTLIVIRNPNSSTQLTTGFAAGVSGRSFSPNLTNTNAGSGDVMTKVSAQNTTGNAEKTIGIMATEVYDVNRDKVKQLAFQAYGQSCLGAVYPDSKATTFDKKNVRDGHYDVFGYTYVVAAVDANGTPTNPEAKKFIDFITGTTAINGADPIVDGAKVGSIPTCAMRVKKSYDGAPIEAFTPSKPCGCYFESIVGTTSCEACPAGTCPSGKSCHFGYCEAN